ncbi:hypothetical protein ABIB85_008466 [Bradyrhizobium sp. JR1.5]
MPKYRVVTPKGASFTVAGSDYSYEREALNPIYAESVEAPANEAEFIAAARTAGAIYPKGIPITKTIIDALESCKDRAPDAGPRAVPRCSRSRG